MTATAHKLARILYTLIVTGKSYDERIVTQIPQKTLNKRLRNLQKQAKKLGLQLVAA